MEPTYKQVAIDLARAAGKIIQQALPNPTQGNLKTDHTLVTKTDLEVDELVHRTLAEHFPDHAILSEEDNEVGTPHTYTWICDPVDGTLPFSLGVPLSVFTIALTVEGAPILGIIYDPFTDRLLIGEKGKGSTLNGQAIRVSQNNGIAYTPIGVSILNSARHDCIEVIKELKEAGAIPLTYPNVYMGSLVATGLVPGLIYFDDKPHDAAALKIIVEEAGGKVTDIYGNEQRYDQNINGLIASNAVIHDELSSITKKAIPLG